MARCGVGVGGVEGREDALRFVGVCILDAQALPRLRRPLPRRGRGMHSNGLEPLTFGSVDRCSIQLSYECVGGEFTKIVGETTLKTKVG